jgi:hypothetical protein
VADDVGAHAVAVDDERREGRRGAEEAGVDDDDADVLIGADASLGEQVVHDAEDDGLGLLPRSAEAHLDGHAQQRHGEVRGLAHARALQHPRLEPYALVVEPPRPREVPDGVGPRGLVRAPRLEHGQVHEVHGPRPRSSVRVRRRRQPRARQGDYWRVRARLVHQGARHGEKRRLRAGRRRRHQLGRDNEERDGEQVRQAADEAVVQQPGVVLRRLPHRPQQLPVHGERSSCHRQLLPYFLKKDLGFLEINHRALYAAPTERSCAKPSARWRV